MDNEEQTDKLKRLKKHVLLHFYSIIFINPSPPLLSSFFFFFFILLLLFSRVLRDSTPRFVGPSVRRSVGPSVGPSVTLYFFWVFAVFGLTAPAQMME